ncbi:lipoyl(octanoyl) transferase LipB [Neisseriaceae bacterium TC5R-5]|nr:lipoyl(octanoyl) transferase LipB [Neisseriaceae bacterium TC5R-5]
MSRLIKQLGRADYETTWRAMQAFTNNRDANTPDELWIVEHPPVYTQGLAGKPEHLLHAGDIPVVHTDRGGQITYHGPGQLVVYLLLDVKRLNMGVRQLVRHIEQAIIDMLAELGIQAHGDIDAPGVYVGDAKIAALGLRIKNHASYHGLSFNIDMDLSPFKHINPCGYAQLKVTDLKQLGITLDLASAAARLLPHLERHLSQPKESA